jgi:hypothetical protein
VTNLQIKVKNKKITTDKWLSFIVKQHALSYKNQSLKTFARLIINHKELNHKVGI